MMLKVLSVALLATTAAAATASLSPHLRHLAERHYAHHSATGETVFLQTKKTTTTRVAPKALDAGDVVHEHNARGVPKTLVVGQVCETTKRTKERARERERETEAKRCESCSNACLCSLSSHPHSLTLTLSVSVSHTPDPSL